MRRPRLSIWKEATSSIDDCEMNQHAYCLIQIIKHLPFVLKKYSGAISWSSFLFLLHCFMIMDSVTRSLTTCELQHSFLSGLNIFLASLVIPG